LSLLNRLQQANQTLPTEKKAPPLHKEPEQVEKPKVVIPSAPVEIKSPKSISKQSDKEIEFKKLVQKEILQEVNLDLDKTDLHQEIEKIVSAVMDDDDSFRTQIDRKKVTTDLVNELTGFGPINPLLLDDSVSEVMVNGPDQVYCERDGRLVLTDIKFRDNEHVLAVIEKIVAPIGRRIDETSPMVDARLPDGSRVNAIIPPLALNGPTITIRKFAKDPFTIDDLIRFGTVTEEMALFFDACVKARLNIFVSGGTGSGKTTTLNVLSSFIPDDERIVTIEDAAELQMRQEHVISLESRPPNIEGTGQISIRDLVRNSLRMRPDRVVIGEVRGEEALDMLQAMNTGHDGSLATGHSNSPRDMISRLETMVLLGGIDLPVRAIRDQISGALDLIIQQSRLKDGSRRIVKVTEVQGLEGDVIVLQDIFVYEQTGLSSDGKIIGRMIPTGVRPRFYENLESSGIHIAPHVFMEKEVAPV
jgi:pilus assembly protein CpaF